MSDPTPVLPVLGATDLTALADALESARQFDPTLSEAERGQLAEQADRINRIVSAGRGSITHAAVPLGGLDARALRYAAGTDAALTGEAYAGLSPDRLRALALRIQTTLT